jgi:hypothetical protein
VVDGVDSECRSWRRRVAVFLAAASAVTAQTLDRAEIAGMIQDRHSSVSRMQLERCINPRRSGVARR